VGQGGGLGAWAQFRGDEHEDRAADHSRGDRAVLGSGLVKGIGPILAKSWWAVRTQVLAVIENRAAELHP